MSETEKEKVLAVYPNAISIEWRGPHGYDPKNYFIYPDSVIFNAISTGCPTQEKAWEDAASKLPRQDARTIELSRKVDDFNRRQMEGFADLDRNVRQAARHEYMLSPQWSIQSSLVCAECGRERNDYEYHFEPKLAPFDIPNRQSNLCSQCGQDQLMLYAIPSGKSLCGSCFNLWAAQPKAEEASEVKRPEKNAVGWCSDLSYRASDADAYMDQVPNLEQQVRELRARMATIHHHLRKGIDSKPYDITEALRISELEKQ